MPALARPRRLASLVFALLMGLTTSALASHYYVSDISDVFTADELALMDRFGIEDTAQLLAWLAPVDRRAAFQSMSGLDVTTVNGLTLFCDLLQVEGVGPSAAQLLLASGVLGAADLASRDPQVLLADVETVNSAELITDTTPTLGHIQAWIAAAAVVPVVVQY